MSSCGRPTAIPGIGGTQPQTRTLTVRGPSQQIGAPAGGTPAAITAVPGLSGILSTFGALDQATAALSVVPAQTAGFSTAPLSSALLLAGPSRVRLTITPKTSTDATLFLSLRDVAPDGTSTLPVAARDADAPDRADARAGRPTVDVTLPWVVHSVPSGDVLVLTVATTDFAYQLPQDARTYTVSLGRADRVR